MRVLASEGDASFGDFAGLKGVFSEVGILIEIA